MTTTDSVRPLGFWEAITATNARWALGASTMVAMAEGTGPLDEPTFVAAAKVLFERHQLLRCRLDAGASGLHFIDDVVFEDIPLPVHHVADEQGMIGIWEQQLHEELPDRRRLWDAVFAPTPDESTWRVLLKVHHAVADGRSLGHLLDQLIEAAGTILRGAVPRLDPEPVPPPAEARLKRPNTTAALHAAMEAAGEEQPMTAWPLDHEADLDCRRTRVAFRSLDETAVGSLIDRCHAERVTLLSAFAAAAAITYARHSQGPVDTDSMVPVDLRPWFQDQSLRARTSNGSLLRARLSLTDLINRRSVGSGATLSRGAQQRHRSSDHATDRLHSSGSRGVGGWLERH